MNQIRILQAIAEAEQHYWNRGNQTIPEVMLDRFFWQALGKARGWELTLSFWCEECQSYEEKKCLEWHAKWHRFIDHLAEGKDAESFFEKL